MKSGKLRGKANKSKIISKYLFNPFLANVPILYPLKKPLVFLWFSGGIKYEYWSEVVEKSANILKRSKAVELFLI